MTHTHDGLAAMERRKAHAPNGFDSLMSVQMSGANRVQRQRFGHLKKHALLPPHEGGTLPLGFESMHNEKPKTPWRMKVVANTAIRDLENQASSTERAVSPGFRFSGHQTFPLRVAWIPKAVGAITDGQDPLTNIDEGIVSLGLGKNMVEALRCWIEAFQIASKEDSGWSLSAVGELVFAPTTGLDPFLEDHSSNWLLHWLISRNTQAPFFAWECLFNRWPTAEFSASAVVEAFRKESEQNQRTASIVTLKQHWEVFLHSYRPPRGTRGEDHLDCALSVLGLIHEAGERQNAAGKWETLYAFDTGPKTAIPQQLFAFFIHDWWNRAFPSEQTVALRELVAGNHSPGRILRMAESEILERVSDLTRVQSNGFQIAESANLRQLRRLRKSNGHDDLRAAYEKPRFL